MRKNGRLSSVYLDLFDVVVRLRNAVGSRPFLVALLVRQRRAGHKRLGTLADLLGQLMTFLALEEARGLLALLAVSSRR